MMFNIHTGYNVRQVPNEEIVILVSSLHRVAELGIPFVFTDQHAYPLMASYFTDLKDLDKVDWDLLNRKDFKHDPDDPGKKDRYQARSSGLEASAGRGAAWNLFVYVRGRWGIQVELAKCNVKMQTTVQRNWYF